MAPNESLNMIFYMSLTQMESLSLIDFKIFAEIAILILFYVKVQNPWHRLKPMYDFLYVYNTNGVSVSHAWSLRYFVKRATHKQTDKNG